MGSKESKTAAPIVVAVDFSTESARALAVAADFSTALDLPLLLLHVVHDPGHAPGFYLAKSKAKGADKKALKKAVKKTAKRTRTICAAAEDMLRDFADQVRADQPHLAALEGARTRLVIGTPAKRIVEVAEEEGAKLIVMGTRGRSPLGGILLGSNAHRVVQLSPIPVTLVKSDKPHKGKVPPAEKDLE